MPACGTNALDSAGTGATGRGTRHHFGPGVEPPVFGAGIGGVSVAHAHCIRAARSIAVVQVLRHPGLGSDGHGSVGLAVPGIRQRAVGNCRVPWYAEGAINDRCLLMVDLDGVGQAVPVAIGDHHRDCRRVGRAQVHHVAGLAIVGDA